MSYAEAGVVSNATSDGKLITLLFYFVVFIFLVLLRSILFYSTRFFFFFPFSAFTAIAYVCSILP